MKILAVDTATSATVVAVLDTVTQIVSEVRDDAPAGARPAHASRLLELVEEVLRTLADGWNDLGRIAVGVGPGSFTGLRIGVASAQGLARARGCPLVGVSTLDSLAAAAAGAAADLRRRPLAVIDARRGEVFAGGDGVVASVRSPERLAELASGRLAVGDGAIRFRAMLEGAGAVVPDVASDLHRVSAVEHCRLAQAAVPGPVHAVLPSYLRAPDAKVPA